MLLNHSPRSISFVFLNTMIYIFYSKISRNFAFFQTNTNGSIWGTDSWADPIVLFGPFNWNPPENETEVLYCSWDSPTNKACNTHSYEEGLIYQVHAAGAEIYPSLGGWSLSDPFPEMAANEETRMNFVNNCVDLVKEYGFDGIDIDWEVRIGMLYFWFSVIST
jgi:chitinase